ncbi:hypothetical protein [Streptomyces sp. NPDC051452]|uniref:hypothetical protein n=1 Tax=Streptomyces sp. NPDC051452 TaxID=3365654 RepID=UPI00378A91E8
MSSEARHAPIPPRPSTPPPARTPAPARPHETPGVARAGAPMSAKGPRPDARFGRPGSARPVGAASDADPDDEPSVFTPREPRTAAGYGTGGGADFVADDSGQRRTAVFGHLAVPEVADPVSPPPPPASARFPDAPPNAGRDARRADAGPADPGRTTTRLRPPVAPRPDAPAQASSETTTRLRPPAPAPDARYPGRTPDRPTTPPAPGPDARNAGRTPDRPTTPPAPGPDVRHPGRTPDRPATPPVPGPDARHPGRTPDRPATPPVPGPDARHPGRTPDRPATPPAPAGPGGDRRTRVTPAPTAGARVGGAPNAAGDGARGGSGAGTGRLESRPGPGAWSPPAPARPVGPPSPASSAAPDPALSWSAGRPAVSFGEPEAFGERTRPRVRPRTAAAAACLVLGLGLIGGAVTGSWLTGDGEDRPSAGEYAGAGTLWHSTPVDTLFPATVEGTGAGPGGADRTWTRIAVAPDSGCAHAFDPLLLKALAPVGCRRLLRATYTDATQTYVTTVGLLFTKADPAAMSALAGRFRGQHLDRRADLMPRPYAAKGTAAAGFGDRQRATWTVSVLTDAPVVAYAVSGWADGRTVDSPQPAADAVRSGATSAPAQAGLGNEAQGLADRVERRLRQIVGPATEKPS